MGNIPAIIVGSGLSALGAARLLGRAGITAYCYGQPQHEAYSRWYTPVPDLDLEQARPERLAAYLATCPLDTAVLIPASDAAVRAITLLPPDLQARFPASVSAQRSAEQLTDKALFAEMLERLGEPGPITRRIDCIEDLQALPETAFRGSFLKPTDSGSFMARFGVKGSAVTSRADAITKADVALSEGYRLVLQEYIPSTLDPEGQGPRTDHILIDGFIDRHGRITALFARRRLRMFPLDFGNTSYMVSIPITEVPEAAASLAHIAQALPCRGIVSGEFKQDPRDGVYKLLEINSRAWWFVEYAGRCGVDVCTMSYLDALDLHVEPALQYRTGAKFAHAYYDFHAIRALHREGRLGYGEAARSWIGAQDPWFNWSDPLPAMVDLAKRIDARRRRSVNRPQTA